MQFALLGFAILAAIVVLVATLALNFTRTTPFSATAQPSFLAESSATPMFGTLSFGSANAIGDTVTLRVENLSLRNTGKMYIAWLQNTLDASVLRLGEVRIDALGNGALVYTDPAGRNLSTLFNAVIVTAEQNLSDIPSQQISYSGSVPVAVSQALYQIMITSTLENIAHEQTHGYGYGEEAEASRVEMSLLDGALFEADIARQHAELAAEAETIAGMHTHAEHTINILLGTQVDYDRNGRGENPGIGYGIQSFLDKIEEQLSQIFDQNSVSNQTLAYNAELIRVCLTNVEGWLNQANDLEQELLTFDNLESATAVAMEAHGLTLRLIDGIDLNDNGQIEPFEGECGLKQISIYSLLLNSISIYEGPLAD